MWSAAHVPHWSGSSVLISSVQGEEKENLFSFWRKEKIFLFRRVKELEPLRRAKMLQMTAHEIGIKFLTLTF